MGCTTIIMVGAFALPRWGTMTRLAISLLGQLQIACDGQPLDGFAYSKGRALLSYLAVEAGRVHERDALVGLLWPDLPNAAARTNLRQVLANLRHVLNSTGVAASLLHITRDTIQLRLDDQCEVDINTFTALFRACAAHRHRHIVRCRACAARLEQAIALYNGEFLAGFILNDSAPFEEWALLHRERCHQLAFEALDHLAAYYERRGDRTQALQIARRQLTLNPWCEEVHRQVMVLLARDGQRSAALMQYQTCRRLLECELGVEPAAETIGLYERIRAAVFDADHFDRRGT
jgi:DNA-binding SARP family transcriptional activator